MLDHARLTKAELLEKYPDKDWREKLIELTMLVQVLENCIIRRSYRPSDGLNDAIRLTESGIRLRTQLTTKEKVNAKEANILTFLKLLHITPLVDVDNIDVDAVALAISEEVREGHLSFPLVFGSELYHRAADLFPEERSFLGHEDTLRLLESMPQGVFQAGKFLVGPWGLKKLDYERRIYPTTSVPLQHCSDVGCHAVHRVSLYTSRDAEVNSSRAALSKVLNQVGREPSAWNSYLAEITKDRRNPYDLKSPSGIALLLGDAFSDAELRLLLIHARDVQGAKFVPACTALGLSPRVEDWIDGLDRARSLQLLFMIDDATLETIVDSAVRKFIIKIPGDEIRRPRIHRNFRTGAWRLRPQASRLGVRMVSADTDLPLLQLSELARSLYNLDSEEERDELDWTIREITGENTAGRLEEFLRSSSPTAIIDRLIMSRRSYATQVSRRFGIPLDLPADEIRDMLLWKLGFPLPLSEDLRDEYWRLHHLLEGLAKTSAIDVSSSAEGLRAASTDYFVCLEKFLMDSLVFATWALLSDHYTDRDPFVFYQQKALEFTLTKLNATSSEAVDPHRLVEEPVLSSIVEGYIRLSKLLVTLQREKSLHVRSEVDFPKFFDKTQLQKFPFKHVTPFLDLTTDSQARMIEALHKVGAELKDSGIMTARNGLLHAKNRVPTTGEVEEALRKARAALDVLESVGCVRAKYSVSSTAVNAWGGSTTTMQAKGRSVSFSSPSPYEWIKLPGLGRPLYLMLGAKFASPNEMLRFLEGFESEYAEYWQEFPRRAESSSPVGSVDDGGAVKETGDLHV
ncbi:hypothetical protein ACIQC0_02205 [Pseudarthrobacter sp. NPDC092419]|uniref:hypothetical protein n=1 Tax=Pseudarthrobacter sp. NPDC092419 TaxID=3364414 RepID=UPI0038152894